MIPSMQLSSVFSLTVLFAPQTPCFGTGSDNDLRTVEDIHRNSPLDWERGREDGPLPP